MSHRIWLVLAVLAVLAACGKKPAEPAPERAPVTAEAPVVSDAANLARLSTGPAPGLGCVAISTSLRAAACVTGEIVNGERTVQLEYVGDAAPTVTLGEQLDEATVTAANTLLERGGFMPVSGDGTTLTAAKAHEVGGGVSITWTASETAPGGDNVAPTTRNVVVATCGGKDVDLFRSEGEGERAAVGVQVVGELALIAMRTQVAREGEQTERFDAQLLATPTCLVARPVR